MVRHSDRIPVRHWQRFEGSDQPIFGWKRGTIMKRFLMLCVCVLCVCSLEAAALLQVGPAPGRLFIDANTEPDMGGYWLYRSDTVCTHSTPTPTNCPTFARVGVLTPQGPDPIVLTDPSFVFATGYFFAATAVNTSLLESEFSNQLPVTWLNPNAPSAPGNLRESEQGVEMRLRWQRNDPTEQVNVWKIYKSSTEEEFGALLATTGGGKGEFGQYFDVNYGRFGPKFYRVTAVDDRGRESAAAGPVKYVGRSNRRVN